MSLPSGWVLKSWPADSLLLSPGRTKHMLCCALDRQTGCSIPSERGSKERFDVLPMLELNGISEVDGNDEIQST